MAKILSDGKYKNFQIHYDASDTGIDEHVTHDGGGITAAFAGEWLDIAGLDNVTMFITFVGAYYDSEVGINFEVEYSTDGTGDGSFLCHDVYRMDYNHYVGTAPNLVRPGVASDLMRVQNYHFRVEPTMSVSTFDFAVSLPVNAPYMRIANLQEIAIQDNGGYNGDKISIAIVGKAQGRG